MKKKISVLTALILVFVLVFTLGACTIGGKNSNTDIDGDFDPSQGGKVTIWWPGSSVEMKALEQAKADYTEKYPKVTIEIIPQSTPDFYSAYLLACSGNSAPDIAYVDHVYVQQLAFYGYIANLSSIGYDEELKDVFVPSLWNSNFYGDDLYALPMSANILATVYNKTLIAKAQGVDVEDITLPTNYEEFVVLANQIAALNNLPDADKSDPYYAITLPSGTGNTSMGAMTFLQFVDRCGGTGILSEDLKTSLLNTEPCINAAKMLYDMGQYSTSTFAEAKFESGKVAFIEMGPWKISDYEKYSKNYGWEVGYTTAIPFTEGGNTGSTLGLYSLVVTNNKNAALAADFAKFVTTNDKYQLEFATAQNLIPATKTALEDEYYSSEVWQAYIAQLDHAVIRPGSPAWTDIEEALGSFVTKLVQRQYDNEEKVQQACFGIHNQITEALNEIYEE